MCPGAAQSHINRDGYSDVERSVEILHVAIEGAGFAAARASDELNRSPRGAPLHGFGNEWGAGVRSRDDGWRAALRDRGMHDPDHLEGY